MHTLKWETSKTLCHDDSFASSHDNSTAALVGLGGSVLGVLLIIISLYLTCICVYACVFVIGVNVFALVGLDGSVLGVLFTKAPCMGGRTSCTIIDATKVVVAICIFKRFSTGSENKQCQMHIGTMH